MSSYITEAQNKVTGETNAVWAIDNYFGPHAYGYSILGDDYKNVLTEEQFHETYAIIQNADTNRE